MHKKNKNENSRRSYLNYLRTKLLEIVEGNKRFLNCKGVFSLELSVRNKLNRCKVCVLK